MGSKAEGGGEVEAGIGNEIYLEHRLTKVINSQTQTSMSPAITRPVLHV